MRVEEYQGINKERGLRRHPLSGAVFGFLGEVIDDPEIEEVNILDVGCGPEALLLQDILKVSATPFAMKNKGLGLYGISDDPPKNLTGIEYISQYITESNRVSKILPEDLKFDLIYSSWMINYLDINTFDVLIRDCYDALKPGGEIIFTPFHPTWESKKYAMVGFLGNKDGFEAYIEKRRISENEIRNVFYFFIDVFKIKTGDKDIEKMSIEEMKTFYSERIKILPDERWKAVLRKIEQYKNEEHKKRKISIGKFRKDNPGADVSVPKIDGRASLRIIKES